MIGKSVDQFHVQQDRDLLACLTLHVSGRPFGQDRTKPPPYPDELRAQQAAQQVAQRRREAEVDHEEMERYLCRVASACKKYSDVRLECATAGNFKTCLRIKMGDDASYSDICSGYYEGAPAVPLSPETPNAVVCYFRLMLH